MNKYFLTAAAAAIVSMGSAVSAETVQVVPGNNGVLPANRTEQTAAYGASHVITKLNVDVKEGTKAVHFIRDNNDPFVVTKAYLLKNADPFIARGVLKSIVAGTLKNSPVAVESIKYVDGTGVLLVSAEEYRFKDTGNGMSMDAVIAAIDKKDLPNSSGTIDMAYFPKYNSAEMLLNQLQISSIGFTGTNKGVVNIETGEEVSPNNDVKTFDQDSFNINPFAYAEVDKNMNAIIMTAPGFDMVEALNFLKTVDTPASEVHFNYKLVEVYANNDQKLGLDFQAWKNNDGIDLFSAGGKWGNNWGSGTLVPNSGSVNVSYYNFNPKWNTKYVDFLTTCGKAKVVSSGSLLVADSGRAELVVEDGVFAIVANDIESQKTVADTVPKSTGSTKSNWHNTRQSNLIDTGILENVLKQFFIRESPKSTGKTQDVESFTGNRLSITLGGEYGASGNGASVHGKASTINIDLSSCSVIGWDGKGNPRMSNSTYNTTVMVNTEGKELVIGGITKSSVVRSVSGVPFLKDIPILGWIFSTETDMIKKSQFVLIANLTLVPVDGDVKKDTKTQLDEIRQKIEKGVEKPNSALGFQQYLLDTKKIKDLQ